MGLSYTALLRFAVVGEPAESAECRVDDWIDHLELYRADHGRIAFTVELWLGLGSHLGSRVAHARPQAFLAPLISIFIALALTPMLTVAAQDSGPMLVVLNLSVAIGVLAIVNALKRQTA